ncbi:AfsR/SARP family transcriptional regulator [Actinophytocola sp.]|uniref:AfsR/SARP family transcriptional regulator n=1 Tax=Actinophytocola sp. TaxID=1872138 RepID=UPI002ED1C9D9
MVVDGVALDLGPARQRCVLAALAVDAGRVVSVEMLTHRVWGEHPPLRARATLMGYLSRLRRILGVGAVVRHPGGYVLEVERSVVDLHRFHELCLKARTRAADDAERVVLLEQALALWQGDALIGIEGDWAFAERRGLRQQRLDAECDLTDALLRLGHGEDLVATLGARAAGWPLDERVAAQFTLALHRAGRTADALAHYRQLRDRLIEQLGTEPGTTLQGLHQRILDTDPALTPPPVTIDGTSAVWSSDMPVPRQLPALPRLFTGRAVELARLDEMLTVEPDRHPSASVPGVSATEPETAPGAPAAGTVAIAAIGGVGGIGKTWLALTWAHRHAEAFPDGQLFVDLRGFSPTEQPVPPDTTLFGFLTALGVVSDLIPTDPDAKAALYRSLVAGKRMLVVLDNAATADQVIPLLPGSPTCTVLVTGRTKLAPLIDRHSAHHLQLDVLTDAEARTLLTGRLGDARVVAEPKAVAELVALCGHHPLALTITARHARTRPDISVAEVTAELRKAGLDALDDDDPAASLPAVLSWSLRALAPEQQTVFALLGIAPGPDIGLSAAADLTGLPVERTRKVLRALEDASLVDRRPDHRYAMHDLVRAYATGLAHDLDESVRQTALTRVIGFYLHTAFTADCLLDPHRMPIRLDPPDSDVHPQPLPDLPAALSWLDIHHPHLLAAQNTAAAHHRHQAVWQLAWALTTYHWRRGHRHDALAVWQVAADAAVHLLDPAARTDTHRLLGRAYANLGRHVQAIAHLNQALVLAEQHHNLAQQAHTHNALAWACELGRDERRALEHARHALDLYRTLDHPVREAVALNAVGWYTARLGDHGTARAHCQAALILFRRHHDYDGEATTLDSLGWIDHHTGHHDQAVHHYQHALTLRRAVGHTRGVADTLDRLGHSHGALGQYSLVRRVWQEALQLYREQGRNTDTERLQQQLDALD